MNSNTSASSQRPVEAERFDGASLHSVDETLVVEAALQIDINGEAFTTTMRTPGHDEALARGLLFTERIVPNPGAVLTFETTPDPESRHAARMNVALDPGEIAKPFQDRRSLAATASCGVCGARELRDIEIYADAPRLDTTARLSGTQIAAMFDAMRERQTLFDATGGCHAAATFTPKGELLGCHEDIGRHNAVDKSIGALLAQRKLEDAACLTVSGRVSYEIVYKAFHSGLPFLLAVSAASSLAVETADRVGITLVAFCRDARATVYTHGDRLDS